MSNFIAFNCTLFCMDLQYVQQVSSSKIFIDINYVPMDITIDVYQKLGIRRM